jgi:O-methyltransferase involved in polyketide biosynthesis
MADRVKVELGAVQETLFVPLAGRALETRRRRAVLRDPKAAEILASVDFDTEKYGHGMGGQVTILRTVIFDYWVSDFLAAHPGGTVVELGTGLNTRFERVADSQTHWIDLDLPDTIELRREFFADSGHRQMVAASVLDEDWMSAVRENPEPYFFTAEGVLCYLEQAPQVIARIARTFPGSLIAFDTYSQRTLEQQHKLAAKKGIKAFWAWSCDEPRTLTSLGLEVVQEAAITRPSPGLRSRLPRRYRYTLPLVRRIAGDVGAVTLFRAC